MSKLANPFYWGIHRLSPRKGKYVPLNQAGRRYRRDKPGKRRLYMGGWSDRGPRRK